MFSIPNLTAVLVFLFFFSNFCYHTITSCFMFCDTLVLVSIRYCVSLLSILISDWSTFISFNFFAQISIFSDFFLPGFDTFLTFFCFFFFLFYFDYGLSYLLLLFQPVAFLLSTYLYPCPTFYLHPQ